MEKKLITPTEILCKGLPSEICTFMNYTKSLRFEDKPDYNFMRKLFKELFIKRNFELDYLYDWCLLAQQAGKPITYHNGKINVQIVNSSGGIQSSDIQGGKIA